VTEGSGEARDPRPHVVVVGGGFGGLEAVKALRRAPVRVTLVDRRNHHLFQPLLYQVATSLVSPADIAYPLRAILRGQANAEFRLACVTGVDLDARRVRTTTGDLDYDFLVVACGGATSFFGIDSVERHGFDLKDIEHAIGIRNHVLRMFELGVQQGDPHERRAMLTFAIVGGGPTGVECAGAFSELCRLVLSRDFPRLDVKDVRVILLEATDRLLAGMPEPLREKTAEILWRKHVEVRFGAQVTDFDGRRVVLASGEVIPARTLVWAAGVRAAELAERLPVERGRGGRIRVHPTLQVPGRDEVYAVGDVALVEGMEDLPGMAPVAMRQARRAASNVARAARGEAPEAFRYRLPVSVAVIGRNAAVAKLGRLRLSGFVAWVLWVVVHIFFLIGFRNRIVVLTNWAWEYVFYERAVRLISRSESARERAPAEEHEELPSAQERA